MATYKEIRKIIKEKIKANFNWEIDGEILQNVLLQMVGTMNYHFEGVTYPGNIYPSLDYKAFYIGFESGPYVGINVPNDSIAIIENRFVDDNTPCEWVVKPVKYRFLPDERECTSVMLYGDRYDNGLNCLIEVSYDRLKVSKREGSISIIANLNEYIDYVTDKEKSAEEYETDFIEPLSDLKDSSTRSSAECRYLCFNRIDNKLYSVHTDMLEAYIKATGLWSDNDAGVIILGHFSLKTNTFDISVHGKIRYNDLVYTNGVGYVTNSVPNHPDFYLPKNVVMAIRGVDNVDPANAVIFKLDTNDSTITVCVKYHIYQALYSRIDEAVDPIFTSQEDAGKRKPIEVPITLDSVKKAWYIVICKMNKNDVVGINIIQNIDNYADQDEFILLGYFFLNSDILKPRTLGGVFSGRFEISNSSSLASFVYDAQSYILTGVVYEDMFLRKALKLDNLEQTLVIESIQAMFKTPTINARYPNKIAVSCEMSFYPLYDAKYISFPSSKGLMTITRPQDVGKDPVDDDEGRNDRVSVCVVEVKFDRGIQVQCTGLYTLSDIDINYFEHGTLVSVSFPIEVHGRLRKVDTNSIPVLPFRPYVAINPGESFVDRIKYRMDYIFAVGSDLFAPMGRKYEVTYRYMYMTKSHELKKTEALKGPCGINTSGGFHPAIPYNVLDTVNAKWIALEILGYSFQSYNKEWHDVHAHGTTFVTQKTLFLNSLFKATLCEHCLDGKSACGMLLSFGIGRALFIKTIELSVYEYISEKDPMVKIGEHTEEMNVTTSTQTVPFAAKPKHIFDIKNEHPITVDLKITYLDHDNVSWTQEVSVPCLRQDFMSVMNINNITIQISKRDKINVYDSNIVYRSQIHPFVLFVPTRMYFVYISSNAIYEEFWADITHVGVWKLVNNSALADSLKSFSLREKSPKFLTPANKDKDKDSRLFFSFYYKFSTVDGEMTQEYCTTLATFLVSKEDTSAENTFDYHPPEGPLDFPSDLPPKNK